MTHPPITPKPGPKPLVLHQHPADPAVVPVEELPPSYAMTPYNMRMDLVDEATHAHVTPSGYRRVGPTQPGEWVLQPQYDALTYICNVRRGSLFTRSMISCSPLWGKSLVSDIQAYPIPKDVEWIQGVRVYPPAVVGDMRAAFIVTDFISEDLPYHERRDILVKAFNLLGIKEKPEAGETYLIPEFSEHMTEDLWLALHLMNQEWNWKFYTGITAKRKDALFHFQVEDHNITSMNWLAYDFS